MDEFITDVVAVTERVQHILPIGAAKNKSLPFSICHVKSFGFMLHHGLKCTFSMRPMS